MAEIIPSTAPAPISVLGFDGTDFYVLKLDSDGHLQVDVQTSALPTGAATFAEQQTQTATLELIALIRNALQSVATDRLKVRGENQLFSILQPWRERVAFVSTGATQTVDGSPVGAGTYRVVTTISASNQSRDGSRILLRYISGSTIVSLHSVLNPVQYQIADVQGFWVLPPDAYIQASFYGIQAGDDLRLYGSGYVMTMES